MSTQKNLNCKVAGAFDHPTGEAGTSVSSQCLGKQENCRLLTFEIWNILLISFLKWRGDNFI